MIAALLAASVIGASCNRNSDSTNRNVGNVNASERSQSKALASDSTLGTIVLSGLMVLHQDQSKGTYEVGVIPATDHGHEFNITVNGSKPKTLPPGRNLTIEVTNSAPTASIPEAKGHAGKRRPDDKNGAYDFDWVIDLEGKEFHDGVLDLTPGVLNPIIHLPNGRLYTKFKSSDLQRRQGAGRWADFGFVPEGLAIDLPLNKDQKLVVKNDSGAEAVLLEYPWPSNPTVKIANILPTPSNASDFHLFYDKLFPKVAKEKRFDFYAKEKNYEVPYNPFPSTQKGCCLMECSTPLLSRRTAPLN